MYYNSLPLIEEASFHCMEAFKLSIYRETGQISDLTLDMMKSMLKLVSADIAEEVFYGIYANTMIGLVNSIRPDHFIIYQDDLKVILDTYKDIIKIIDNIYSIMEDHAENDDTFFCIKLSNISSFLNIVLSFFRNILIGKFTGHFEVTFTNSQLLMLSDEYKTYSKMISSTIENTAELFKKISIKHSRK